MLRIHTRRCKRDRARYRFRTRLLTRAMLGITNRSIRRILRIRRIGIIAAIRRLLRAIVCVAGNTFASCIPGSRVGRFRRTFRRRLRSGATHSGRCVWADRRRTGWLS